MALHIMPGRQRVPMLDATTLEDRTRPALDGTAESRLRYFSWPTWYGTEGRSGEPVRRLTHVRLPRRLVRPTSVRRPGPAGQGRPAL